MSYSVKKVGIPFIPKINVNPDASASAGNFSLSYVLDSDPTVNIPVAGAFTEGAKAGTFFAPSLTIGVKGDYTFTITNDVDGLGNASSPVVVVGATIDDLKDLIDVAQADITSIKSVTDLLNTTELENLAEDIAQVQTNLGSLTTLIDTVDGGDGITSIRELLIELDGDGVTSSTALLASQDDIKAMLNGDAFLSDGTTVNPLSGKGLDNIYDDVLLAISNCQTAIQGNIASFKTSVEGKVDDVKAVVDANSASLNNGTYGLSALKTILDGIDNDLTNIGSDTDSILSAVTDGTNGLVAIKSLLVTMDGKLDTINTKVDNISTSTVGIAFA